MSKRLREFNNAFAWRPNNLKNMSSTGRIHINAFPSQQPGKSAETSLHNLLTLASYDQNMAAKGNILHINVSLLTYDITLYPFS